MTLTTLVNVATFLFFALSLCAKSGYSYGTLLLLGAALATLPRWWGRRARGPAINAIALGFVLMGLAGIGDAWFSGLGATYYNIPSRFLIIALLLFFLSVHPPDPRAIWLGAACGAVLGAISAHYYSHYAPEMLQFGRGARYLNPIQFGNIAVLLAVFCACGLRSHPGSWVRGALMAGIAAGLYAALLSETRGSLVGLGFALGALALLKLRWRHLHLRNIGLAVALGGAALGTLWLKDDTIIEERISAARQDIALYQQGTTTTSVGTRLEMWRFAWHEGWQHPLLGAGTAQMRQDMAAWDQAQPQATHIARYGHLHNEFLDAFARRGLLGLALVLFLTLLPLRLYWRAPPQPGSDPQIVALWLAGVSHLLLYIGFGLTQAALYGHNSGFHFFALPLFLFYTAWQARLGSVAPDGLNLQTKGN
ncbi:MAG: O-antigen ligase family protein [Comamonadaceae bacterium]|nr:O-antigen ligase family protein [Comamonadaceae bacterium]